MILHVRIRRFTYAHEKSSERIVRKGSWMERRLGVAYYTRLGHRPARIERSPRLGATKYRVLSYSSPIL